MRTRHAGRAVSALAACALIAVGLAARPVHAQTVDEIVQANIEAVGGEAALRAIESMVATGRISIASSFGGSMDGTVEIGVVPGRGAYTVWNAGGFSGASGWDGTTAWENGPQGFRRLEGADLARASQQGWMNVFIGLRETGPADAAIERLDDATIDGVDHFVLQISGTGIPTAKLYIDKTTHLITRQESTVVAPQIGELALRSDLSGYEPHGGVQIATHVVNDVGDGLQTISVTLEETELNAPVDEARFSPPQ